MIFTPELQGTATQGKVFNILAISLDVAGGLVLAGGRHVVDCGAEYPA